MAYVCQYQKMPNLLSVVGQKAREKQQKINNKRYSKFGSTREKKGKNREARKFLDLRLQQKI